MDPAWNQIVAEKLAACGITDNDAVAAVHASEWTILAHRQYLGGASQRVIGHLLERGIREATPSLNPPREGGKGN